MVGIAGVARRQVQDDDEGHLVIGRHVLEQAQQRRQAAGGRTNAHHGERQVGGTDRGRASC
jgi:hypothetical protein